MTFGVLGFGGLGLRAHGYHHNLKGSVTKIHGELTAEGLVVMVTGLVERHM